MNAPYRPAIIIFALGCFQYKALSAKEKIDSHFLNYQALGGASAAMARAPPVLAGMAVGQNFWKPPG
jgi:hypothetical protein